MNEVFGCGLYPGPSQHDRLNKTDCDRRKSLFGKEMQSDNRFVTRLATTTQYATKEQFNDQQKPKSSGQRHHLPGLDGKSLEALLDRTLRPGD